VTAGGRDVQQKERVRLNPLGLLIVAAGLVTAAGGVFNWEWFMNNRRARLLSKIITRSGARVLYVVLGVGFVITGTLMTIGVIENLR